MPSIRAAVMLARIPCVAVPRTHLYHAARPQRICIVCMMRNLVELKFTIPLY